MSVFSATFLVQFKRTLADLGFQPLWLFLSVAGGFFAAP